jgi:hypothetical protein
MLSTPQPPTLNTEGKPSNHKQIASCVLAISRDPDVTVVRVKNRLEEDYEAHRTAGKHGTLRPGLCIIKAAI